MNEDQRGFADYGGIGADAIEGYRILQGLGRGSMGLVYRAVQLSMRREVALKILAPQLADDEAFVERFRREAQMAGAVHHPNVITCYDAGESGGYLYQALELIEGGDLQELMRRGEIDEERAVGIALDCAQGLEGIHAVGLSHGDITPPNIFVNAEGLAKIGDLGLARSLIIDAREDRRFPSSGARVYRAPETARPGTVPDVRSDIFSLGAVLFHLLTGEAPFLPESAEEDEWLDERPDDPRSLAPDVGAGVAAVVRKCLARDPFDRYSTPAQLREDLERVAYRFAPLHARSDTRSWSSDEQPGTGALARARTRALESSGGRTAVRTPAAPVTSRTRRRRTTVRRQAASEPVTGTPAAENSTGVHPLVICGLVVLVVAGLVTAAMLASGPDGGPEPTDRREASATGGASDDGGSPPAAGMRQPEAVPSATRPPAEPAAVDAADVPASPAWASATGEDDHGRWADVEIAGELLRFRYCPPGDFAMGSPAEQAGRGGDETRRQVTVSRGFWLGATELSQDVWLAVTEENPSHFKAAGRPVEFVSWSRVQDFLALVRERHPELPLRLPTEAEWEYACRAGTAAPPPLDARGWCEATSGGSTQPIASLPPNAWGLHDMLGNVMEWCADAYGRYDELPTVDPVREDGLFRVARGGAWSFPAASCRPAVRTRYQPRAHFFFLGVRLALDGSSP